MVLGAFLIYEWEINHGVSITSARTVVANVVIFVEMAYLFSCRSLTEPITRIGIFTNRWVLLGALLMIILQVLFVYLPLMQRVFQTAAIPPAAWLDVIVVAISTSIVVEVEKWMHRRHAHQRGNASAYNAGKDISW